jgi:sugar phosphate isomerase/epimerase
MKYRLRIGLEWEPTHQMVQLIDPLPQLKQWMKKIVHIHGKDATIDWDAIRRYGIYEAADFVYHRTPGFGDNNWRDIIPFFIWAVMREISVLKDIMTRSTMMTGK